MKKRFDVIIFWISFVGLAVILAYGYGILTAEFEIFPYHSVRTAITAAAEKYGLSAAQFVFSKKHDKYPFLWSATNETTTGVVVHQRDKTAPGFTFFCDAATSAYLIDMNGNVVHKWKKIFMMSGRSRIMSPLIWPHHVKT